MQQDKDKRECKTLTNKQSFRGDINAQRDINPMTVNKTRTHRRPGASEQHMNAGEDVKPTERKQSC